MGRAWAPPLDPLGSGTCGGWCALVPGTTLSRPAPWGRCAQATTVAAAAAHTPLVVATPAHWFSDSLAYQSSASKAAASPNLVLGPGSVPEVVAWRESAAEKLAQAVCHLLSDEGARTEQVGPGGLGTCAARRGSDEGDAAPWALHPLAADQAVVALTRSRGSHHCAAHSASHAWPSVAAPQHHGCRRPLCTIAAHPQPPRPNSIAGLALSNLCCTGVWRRRCSRCLRAAGLCAAAATGRLPCCSAGKQPADNRQALLGLSWSSMTKSRCGNGRVERVQQAVCWWQVATLRRFQAALLPAPPLPGHPPLLAAEASALAILDIIEQSHRGLPPGAHELS
jgi:hypothetical protein